MCPAVQVWRLSQQCEWRIPANTVPACLTLVCRPAVTCAQALCVEPCPPHRLCLSSLGRQRQTMAKGDDSEYLDLHQKSWSNVAIDAITVDIKRESVVNVMVPAAPLLLSPHWSWINCEDHPESDPALLCQELSLSAARYFTRSPYSAEVVARHPGTTFKHISGRHKKQLLQLGDDVTLLQQANSDRPFFCTETNHPFYCRG